MRITDGRKDNWKEKTRENGRLGELVGRLNDKMTL